MVVSRPRLIDTSAALNSCIYDIDGGKVIFSCCPNDDTDHYYQRAVMFNRFPNPFTGDAR